MGLKDHLTFILLTVALVVYVLVGAAVFHAIEGPLEQANIQLSGTAFTSFLANNTCVSQADLVTFLTLVKQLSDAGVTVGNTTQTSSVWSYPSSVFFTGTIVTTIGYGHQSPTVPQSRLFCCFYLIFGIPLCLVFLAKVGNMMAYINNAFVDKLVKWPKGERKRSALSLGLLVVIGIVLLVFIPCISFTYVEGWSYGTSLYFAIITLSTVGFGDYYVGAATDNWIYRLVNGAWIFFGLAWFASILSTIQEEMSSRVDKIENRKDVEKDDSAPKSQVDKEPGLASVGT